MQRCTHCAATTEKLSLFLISSELKLHVETAQLRESAGVTLQETSVCQVIAKPGVAMHEGRGLQSRKDVLHVLQDM